MVTLRWKRRRGEEEPETHPFANAAKECATCPKERGSALFRIVSTLVFSCVFLTGLPAICNAQQTWMLCGGDGKWRTFTSEREWRKAAVDADPLGTAVVTKTTKDIRIVYDVGGESGDWRNIDHYSFKTDGTLIKLERRFASVSEDLLLTQTYGVDSSGKLMKISEREESLNTKKAKTDKIETPQLPIATKLDQLDFIKIH